MPVALRLEAIDVRLAVCRLDADSEVPTWVDRSNFDAAVDALTEAGHVVESGR